jgi:hypothetical protein
MQHVMIFLKTNNGIERRKNVEMPLHSATESGSISQSDKLSPAPC